VEKLDGTFSKPTAEEMIARLGLVPLPGEGGYFRETYRHPPDPSGRSLGTAIYYLITPTSFSRLHRLGCDEMYHFYAGDPIELVQVTDAGQISSSILGEPTIAGAIAQTLIPAGRWQGSRLLPGGEWGLVGTTCWPAFEFADFELADPSLPLFQSPQLQTLLPGPY
jgi:predicted cupin superfamily sugar epimerase